MTDMRFRIWNNEIRQWSVVYTLHDLVDEVDDRDGGVWLRWIKRNSSDKDYCCLPYDYREWKVFRSTGMKDRHGTEIFDGDVIELAELGTRVVRWSDVRGCFEAARVDAEEGLEQQLLSEILLHFGPAEVSCAALPTNDNQ